MGETFVHSRKNVRDVLTFSAYTQNCRGGSFVPGEREILETSEDGCGYTSAFRESFHSKMVFLSAAFFGPISTASA